jgi:hypothetical protein
VRAPDHAHTGTTTSLDTRDRIFKNKALLGGDRSFTSRKAVVDGLQSEKKDVGQRLSAARSQAGIVSKDTAVGRKNSKKLLEVACLNTEVTKMGASGQSDVNPLRLAAGLALSLSSSTILDLPISGSA